MRASVHQIKIGQFACLTSSNAAESGRGKEKSVVRSPSPQLSGIKGEGSCRSHRVRSSEPKQFSNSSRRCVDGTGLVNVEIAAALSFRQMLGGLLIQRGLGSQGSRLRRQSTDERKN